MNLIDLTGKKFGRYTVLKRIGEGSPTKWACRCSCGKEKTVSGSNLRNRLTKSCGCFRSEKISRLKRRNITGMKFGRLTVVRHSFGQRPRCFCVCECGTKKVIESTSLIGGLTRSCGCLRSEVLSAKGKPPRLAAIILKARVVMSSNKAKILGCDLKHEELVGLLSMPCIYCGSTDKIGIDRLDSRFGYMRGNSAPCCPTCNYAKSNLPLDKFLEWIERISQQVSVKNKILSSINALQISPPTT